MLRIATGRSAGRCEDVNDEGFEGVCFSVIVFELADSQKKLRKFRHRLNFMLSLKCNDLRFCIC